MKKDKYQDSKMHSFCELPQSKQNEILMRLRHEDYIGAKRIYDDIVLKIKSKNYNSL